MRYGGSRRRPAGCFGPPLYPMSLAISLLLRGGFEGAFFGPGEALDAVVVDLGEDAVYFGLLGLVGGGFATAAALGALAAPLGKDPVAARLAAFERGVAAGEVVTHEAVFVA